MNVIPIVFCFDDNWEIPAGVCITSLLENSKGNTFYDIYILYDETCRYVFQSRIKEIPSIYSNCKITFRSVGNPFEGAFEIRGISVSTYYRLLIPDLIPEYDKIMYHDVDVIFRNDLSAIFNHTNIDDFYIAGVVSSAGLNKAGRKKRERHELDWKKYILAGNIILNSKKLREDGVVEMFKHEVRNSQYEYQDMDIINIVCKGRIKILPPVFCGTIGGFELAAHKTEQVLYTQEELQEMQEKGVIHYNGPKPWDTYCPNFDIWWEYYRKSVYYDSKFYFDFYNSKLHELDQWSLWKRVKLLLRYFKTFSLRK